MKCYSGLFCALAESHPFGHKNYQLGAPDDELRSANKHFWRRCRGSNWLKILLNRLIILYSFITANFSRLTTAVFVFMMNAGQCMTSFNLPSNFNPNPERIGRIVRRRYVPPQISLSLETDSSSESSESSYSSAPPSPTVMATKTLREFSAPQAPASRD